MRGYYAAFWEDEDIMRYSPAELAAIERFLDDARQAYPANPYIQWHSAIEVLCQRLREAESEPIRYRLTVVTRGRRAQITSETPYDFLTREAAETAKRMFFRHSAREARIDEITDAIPRPP
jgi:hypothetical protein